MALFSYLAEILAHFLLLKFLNKSLFFVFWQRVEHEDRFVANVILEK